ncbi:hypothetical protein B0J12DRAFT_693339 [Macrophomina phaseolina]|uniref:Uncharacterized protein n=1 Tax=Macrophomina phaseolina TaxID=35725 RepID=A0ABQ8GUM0_9PEZI|nr:hypothetical protein B0J12DRAFT_693339 [Macrophomina phaseolina]
MATSPNDITAAFVADAISVQEAAQKLAAPSRDAFEKNADLGKVEHELEGLWSAVISAAEQTPHDQQDKLVDIVRTIKEMPQPVHEGKKLEIWGEEQRWEQLPLFSAKAREGLDIAQSKSDNSFVNLNAFFARLTAADVSDFSLYAVWILREALEDPEDEDIAKTTSPALLEAASVWLVYAAETLSKLSKEGKQFDGKMARPGRSLSIFKDAPGWRGFCEDRWETWIERLTPLKEAEVATEAKTLISQALDKASKV